MKNIALLIPMVVIVLVSGCGSPTKETSGGGVSTPVATTQATSTQAPTPSSSPTATPTPAKTPEQKELSATEKIALEYVTIFVNGSDKAAKEKFVAEKVHVDAAAVFKLGVAVESNENALKSPRIMESLPYESGGKKGETVLVQGEDNKEMIVLIMEGKLGFSYSPGSKDADIQKAYTEMRAKFKTAVQK